MSDTPDLEASAELLKALAHPLRLAILRTIAPGERTVGAIEAETGIGQPGLSQQLAVLRGTELVLTRRASKQVFYRINHARIAAVSALLDAFAGTVCVTQEEAQAVLRMRTGGGVAMFARIG